MLFFNFLCLYCLIVLASSHTISKSIAHEEIYDEQGNLNDFVYLADYAPRYERHNKPRKEEKVHKITKQTHIKGYKSASLTEPPKILVMQSTMNRKSKKSLRGFTSLWKSLKHKKKMSKPLKNSDQIDTRSLYGITQLRNPNIEATTSSLMINPSKLRLLYQKRKREVRSSSKSYIYGPVSSNFATVQTSLDEGKIGQSPNNLQTQQTKQDLNNLVNVDGKTVCVLSDLSRPANEKPLNMTATNPIINNVVPLPVEDSDNTGRIEDLLNSIKAKVVEILSDHSSHLHESNMISNTVTVTTFRMDPSLFVGYTSLPFTTEPLNYKKVDFNITSLSDKHAIQARPVRDLEKIKCVCNKVIHKVSKDFKNEIRETAKAIKSMTQSTPKKACDEEVKKKPKTTKAPAKKKKKKPCCPKTEVESGLIESSKISLASGFTTSLAITSRRTTKRPEKSTKHDSKKVRQANDTFAKIWNHVRRNRFRTTHQTSPRAEDDYILLSLYEQMLTKSDMVNHGGKTAPVKRSYNSEKALLSKRNTETLTDISLKENIQDIFNDGEVMPEVSDSENEVNQKSVNIDLEKPATVSDDKRFQTESDPEDVTIEGLSNKLSYKDYINGFKYYLKFQKELKKENFSDLVKYQAHRHHNVDDIGKYILEKLPQVPNIHRNKRRFFDDDTMDDQDISTRSDDSWFKKHFYFFIDNGPPKKFHTSQTVPLKSYAKSTTNLYEDEISDVGKGLSSKNPVRQVRSPSEITDITKNAYGLEPAKLNYVLGAVNRKSRHKELLNLLDKVALSKINDRQHFKTSQKTDENNPTTSLKTKTKLLNKTKRDDITTEFSTDSDKNPCDNSTCDECGGVNKNKDKPENKKNKSIDYDDNTDDIVILSNSKKLVRLRQSTPKSGKLNAMLSKLRFFKNNKTSKVKRSYQSKPSRFSALQHLKNMFLGDQSEKPKHDTTFTYESLDRQLSMYKIPNIDSLYNQIPNITDLETTTMNQLLQKQKTTNKMTPLQTWNDPIIWSSKYAKYDIPPMKTPNKALYKKPRPKQFYPMSRFVSKDKDLKKVNEDYSFDESNSKFKDLSESSIPKLFHFHSKHGRTKVTKTTKNSGLEDFFIFNSGSSTSYTPGYEIYEKFYRTTDTKALERDDVNENDENDTEVRFDLKEFKKINNYPNYLEKSSDLDMKPVLNMFEVPNADLSQYTPEVDSLERNDRRVKLSFFRKRVSPEKPKPLKDSTKKLYEVPRIQANDDDDEITQHTSDVTTELSAKTYKLNSKDYRTESLKDTTKLADKNKLSQATANTQAYKSQNDEISKEFINSLRKNENKPFKNIVKEPLREQNKDAYKESTRNLNKDSFKQDENKEKIKAVGYNTKIFDLASVGQPATSSDDTYSPATIDIMDLPMDFEDFYIMNSDILHVAEKQPTWQSAVENASKIKYDYKTPDMKKMLKEVEEMTENINMDFEATTKPNRYNYHNDQYKHKSQQSQYHNKNNDNLTTKPKVIPDTFIRDDIPKVGQKRLVTKHRKITARSDDQNENFNKMTDAAEFLKQIKTDTSSKDATNIFDSEITKSNFQSSEASSRMIMDTTLLAYDDGADILATDPETMPSEKASKLNTKRNKNTPPKQFFSTPVPMKYNQFEHFLKENDLDLFSLTSPLENVPRLHSYDLKHRLYANPTKIIKMDRQFSKDCQRADVDSLANKTKKIKQFFHMTSPANRTTNLTEMTKITLFRDVSINNHKPSKRMKFAFYGSTKPVRKFTKPESSIHDDVFTVIRSIENENETTKGEKLNGNTDLQNPIEEITERSPHKNFTNEKQFPDKSKHIRYKTYKKTNPRVLYPLPFADHKMITRGQSDIETHNSLLYKQGAMVSLNPYTASTKGIEFSEVSNPDHEFTTFYSHHGPAVKLGKGKKPHPKQVHYSNQGSKYDVSSEDKYKKLIRQRNSDMENAKERTKYSVTKTAKPSRVIQALDYTKPSVLIHIDLPTYYLPNTDPYQTDFVLAKKLSWHDHIVRCISGLALVELLNKYGFIKTIDVTNDKNLNSSKVFSESHAKRYMEVTPAYTSEVERHGRYLKNDLFKKLQETATSPEAGRTASRNLVSPTFNYGETAGYKDLLVDEKYKEESDKYGREGNAKNIKDNSGTSVGKPQHTPLPMEYEDDYYGDYKGTAIHQNIFMSEEPNTDVHTSKDFMRTEKSSGHDDEDSDTLIDESNGVDDNDANYENETPDDINVNFEKIIIEKGFKVFSKKKKHPQSNFLPKPHQNHNEYARTSKRTYPYFLHKNQDPLVLTQEITPKSVSNKSYNHMKELHKELEQIFDLHQEVLGKISYLRNKFHDIQNGITGRGKDTGSHRQKREKYVKRHTKRDANLQTYTAKDVSALEVIVDLVKNIEPEAKDSKGFSTKTVFGKRQTVKYKTQDDSQSVADNSSLELHICIPNDFDECKRSSDQSARVRKVFSAIMSTPVDIEYQIRSFVDETVTVSTIPTINDQNRWKPEQTVKVFDNNKMLESSTFDKEMVTFTPDINKQISTENPIIDKEMVAMNPVTEKNKWKTEQTVTLGPANNIDSRWKNDNSTTCSSLLPSTPLISTELSQAENIISGVRAYTLTTPTKVMTLAYTGTSFTPLLSTVQRSTGKSSLKRPKISWWQHVTMRDIDSQDQSFTTMKNDLKAKNTHIKTSTPEENVSKSTELITELAAKTSFDSSLPTLLHVSISDPKVISDINEKELGLTSKTEDPSMNVLVTLSQSNTINSTSSPVSSISNPILNPTQKIIKIEYPATVEAPIYARRSFPDYLAEKIPTKTKLPEMSDLVYTTEASTKNVKTDQHEESDDDTNEIWESSETVESTETTTAKTETKATDESDYEDVISMTSLFSIDGNNTYVHKEKTLSLDTTISPKTEKFMPLSMPIEKIPPNVTTNKPGTSARVTLSKEFIAAVDDRVIQLFLNLTKLQNKGLIYAVKTKRESKEKNEVNSEVKKILKRDANCKSSPTSDAVLAQLVSEFDHLARFLSEHCSEVKSYLYKNPTGRRKLRDIIHRIDNSMDDYDSKQNEKPERNFNKIDVDNESHPDDKQHTRNCSNCFNFQQLFSLSNNLNKAMNLDIYPSKNLTQSAKNFYDRARNCLSATPNKNDNDSIKNVYSLDKINVNIICKPNEASDNKELIETIRTLEPKSPEPINELDFVDISESTYPSTKKAKRIKNLFFFKGNKHKPAKMAYARNYLVGRDSGVWLPIIKTSKKRNADYMSQLEPPIITDTGGSFWQEYLKNDIRNSRASVKNFASDHSSKLKRRFFKSRVRDLHTSTSTTTGLLDLLRSSNDIVPDISGASQTFYNVNIFGTVNPERPDISTPDGCICLSTKEKYETTQTTLATEAKTEAKSTSKRSFLKSTTKQTKVTRKPKQSHKIATKTTLSPTKLGKTTKKKNKQRKTKSTKSSRKPTTRSTTTEASRPFFSSTPLKTSKITKKSTTALEETAKSAKMWKKILSTFDFYRHPTKGKFDKGNTKAYAEELINPTNALNTAESMLNHIENKRAANTTENNDSNLLLSIYLYKKRRSNGVDIMPRSVTKSSTETPLSFNTTDLINESTKMIIENITNTLATTPKTGHSFGTLYPELKALFNKMKPSKKKVVPETKKIYLSMKKRNDKNLKRRVVTEEPDSFPRSQLVCDLPATYGDILKIYRQLPQEQFDKYVENIKCTTFTPQPSEFLIKLGAEPKTLRNVFTKAKRTVKWNWIRRKRSIDTSNKDSSKTRKDGNVKEREKVRGGRQDFEEFVRDDFGVYRVKYRKRKKRQETRETQELPAVSVNKDIFVYIGDSVVMNCLPHDAFAKTLRSSNKEPIWDNTSELMKVGNVVVNENRLTVKNVQPKNDGEYYCKNKAFNKRVKLTVITLPHVNLIYIPVYTSENECEDISKSFPSMDSLAREVSQYLCPSAGLCTVSLNEPFCLRDTRYNKAHIQSTAIVAITPPPLPCKLGCRKALLSGLASLSANNLKQVFDTPVIISYANVNKTLQPALNNEVYGFWRHSLTPRFENRQVARFGNYVLDNKANAYILKSVASMLPLRVRSIPSCPAGFYFIRSHSYCAVCPPNSTSTAGQNVCVSRDERNSRARCVGDIVRIRIRRFEWHSTSIIHISLYILTVCTLTACFAAFWSRRRHEQSRRATDSLKRSVMNIDAQIRKGHISAHLCSSTSANKPRRPLSPSRVILTKLFHSPRQNNNAQEDKFKKWKLQNSRPPVPPVDFDW